MADIDLVPEVVNVTGYAGDSIILDVVLDDPSVVAGATWKAHVKAARADVSPLETFTCTPTAEGVQIELTPAQTAGLGGVPVGMAQPLSGVRQESEPQVSRSTVGAVSTASPQPLAAVSSTELFTGEYDVQADVSGQVTTVVQGGLSIMLDVTRGA